MTKPVPRKPKIARELLDALLPPPPPAHPPAAITIQVAAGSHVTVVVTSAPAPGEGHTQPGLRGA